MDKKTKTGVGVALGVGLAAGIAWAIHAKEEVFKCPFCGAEFPTLAELQQHCANQHPNERLPIVLTWD